MADKPHVLVAMSGGVDSSTAAALLQRDGYEVTGIFMCFGVASGDNPSHHGCCSPEDAGDARDVASRLGIRFHTLNFQKDIQSIIDYFIDEYRRARTPNPCIVCNRKLKFGKLLEYARLINADYVATGHYARFESIDGIRHLCRGLDNDKDQSYALFDIERKTFDHVLFPVGQYTKKQVRQIASQMKLPVHDKNESQEICFVPDDDYAGFIARRCPELAQTGPVLDSQGRLLGEHQGIFHYTIGQRRGLAIALGEPAYVIRLDAHTNTVVLGSREELGQKRLWASRVNWLTNPIPSEPFDACVQIRYNHRGAPARVTPLPDKSDKLTQVLVDFAEPVTAITPGQAAVFYNDQVVIGGGWIDRGM